MTQRVNTEWTACSSPGLQHWSPLTRLTSEAITNLALHTSHLRAFLYSPNICVCIPEQDTSFLKTDFAEA